MHIFARSVPGASHVAYTALALVIALLAVVLLLWAKRERQVRRLQRELTDLRRYVVHLDEADRLAAVPPPRTARTRHLASVANVASPVRGFLDRARAHPVVASLAAAAAVIAVAAVVLGAASLLQLGATPDIAVPRPEEATSTPEPRTVEPPPLAPPPKPPRPTHEVEAVTGGGEGQEEETPPKLPRPRTSSPHHTPSPTPTHTPTPTPTPETTTPNLPKAPERIPPVPTGEPRTAVCGVLVCIKVRL